MRIQLLILFFYFVNCNFALRILSFGDDNDDKADYNGEFTSASLEKENLPESFTLCAAFSVEAWNSKSTMDAVPTIHTDDGEAWGYVRLEAGSNFTHYDVLLGSSWMPSKVSTLLFPLQWTRYCLSVNSADSKLRLVVDGVHLAQASYNS